MRYLKVSVLTEPMQLTRACTRLTWSGAHDGRCLRLISITGAKVIIARAAGGGCKLSDFVPDNGDFSTRGVNDPPLQNKEKATSGA